MTVIEGTAVAELLNRRQEVVVILTMTMMMMLVRMRNSPVVQGKEDVVWSVVMEPYLRS